MLALRLTSRGVRRASDFPVDFMGIPMAAQFGQAQVIARGNTLVHILNGHVFMVAVEDDPERRAMNGSFHCSSKARAKFGTAMFG